MIILDRFFIGIKCQSYLKINFLKIEYDLKLHKVFFKKKTHINFLKISRITPHSFLNNTVLFFIYEMHYF